MANMKGIAELAESIFDLPVRIGRSIENIGGIIDIVDNPAYATGVGLAIHAAKGDIRRINYQKERMKRYFQRLWKA